MTRTRLAALAVLPLAACALTPPSSMKPVPFRIVESREEAGNWIEIGDVRCNRSLLVASATVRVRGSYRLASREHGSIYFGLSDGSFDGATSRSIAAGAGRFDFTMYVKTPGDAHVSLYADEQFAPNDSCIAKRRFTIELR